MAGLKGICGAGVRGFTHESGVNGDTYKDNALELFRSNETVLVIVEVSEGLSETFALQTFHELRELAVCKAIRIRR